MQKSAPPVERQRGPRRGTSTGQTEQQTNTAVATTHRELTGVEDLETTRNDSDGTHTASLATARKGADSQVAHTTYASPPHLAQTHSTTVAREASIQAASATSARAPAGVQFRPLRLSTRARPQPIPAPSAAALPNQARSALRSREAVTPDKVD